MADRWSLASDTRTLLPLLLALTVLELGGGLTLGSNQATLVRYPSLLVLVPVTIGTAGNLGSVLAARLSTAFHLGLLSFRTTDEHLLGNAVATVLLAVTVFPVVGAGAWAVSWAGGRAQLPAATVVAVALASGVALAGVVVVVTLVAAAAAYRLELNPDDVVIPVVTNVCDVLGVVVLVGVIRLLVASGGGSGP